jgi:hypothetical protein
MTKSAEKPFSVRLPKPEIQDSTFNRQRNTKPKAPNDERCGFGAWSLDILWSLVLGTWNFRTEFEMFPELLHSAFSLLNLLTPPFMGFVITPPPV